MASELFITYFQQPGRSRVLYTHSFLSELPTALCTFHVAILWKADLRLGQLQCSTAYRFVGAVHMVMSSC